MASRYIGGEPLTFNRNLIVSIPGHLVNTSNIDYPVGKAALKHFKHEDKLLQYSYHNHFDLHNTEYRISLGLQQL